MYSSLILVRCNARFLMMLIILHHIKIRHEHKNVKASSLTRDLFQKVETRVKEGKVKKAENILKLPEVSVYHIY